MPKTKDTAFQVWIKKTGTNKVAKLLSIEPMTVHRWKVGLGLPRSWQMLKVKKLSGISLDQMIQEFHAK